MRVTGWLNPPPLPRSVIPIVTMGRIGVVAGSDVVGKMFFDAKAVVVRHEVVEGRGDIYVTPAIDVVALPKLTEAAELESCACAE